MIWKIFLIYWRLDSLGDFNTKSATWLAHKSQQLSGPDWDHKCIWKVDTMPKIQIFLWQLFHEALPVKGILIKRGLNHNPSCSLCLDDIESADHLFKDWCVTKRVWELAIKHRWIIHGSPLGGAQDLLSQLRMIGSHHAMHKVIQKVYFLPWSIWKFRNNVVFSNEFFNPLASLLMAKKAYTEWRIQSCISMDILSKGLLLPPLTPLINLFASTPQLGSCQNKFWRFLQSFIDSWSFHTAWLDMQGYQNGNY